MHGRYDLQRRKNGHGYRKKKDQDYLAAVAATAKEERAGREESAELSETAGKKVVDYLAVSRVWKENRGWMDNKPFA